MNPVLIELEQEMAACYPKLWSKTSPDRLSLTKRAQVLGKLFKDAWIIHIYKKNVARIETEIKKQLAAEKEEKKADYKKKIAEQHYRYWNNIVMTASGTFADCSLEYCQQDHPEATEEEISEIHCGGAWNMSKSQEEECMREALYAHWAAEADIHDTIKWYDTAVKFWKKNHF